MALLNEETVQHKLQSIPDWNLEQHEIVRTFSFPDFITALQFVNRVGENAEALGHHPDIDIRYNKVRLALTSHDAGGLTEMDFSLAASCDSTSEAIHK
ncbi:MAG TPA: 4a-hydroxytetrahydrobiopterin dehydratase [Acidisarcina sp.]|nr:4a-hydroxytetrahydrobiopterin dehydratase [Acidisarcina sp.]